MNIEKGKQYTDITCVDLSTDFVGICFVEGKKIFIENFLPDEIADIEIIEKKSKFIKGKILKYKKQSEMRQNSLSEQFPDAIFGGCDLQNINYQSQLKVKKQLVEKIARLQKQGKSYTFSDVVASPKETYYRNRTHYHIYIDKQDGKIKAGFYQKGTRNIQEATADFLSDPHIFETLQLVLEKLNANDVVIEDKAQKVRGLKAIMLRYAESKEELLLIFISSQKKQKDLQHLAQELVLNESMISGAVLNYNPKNQGAILGESTSILAGKPMLQDELLGLDFKIPATAFYQVNKEQTQNIYLKVVETLKAHKQATLIDFYCGIGTLSLLSANHVNKVIGVDIVDTGIEAAKENALRNNVKNAEFVNQDVDTFIQDYPENDEEVIAIVDPPRGGCSKNFIHQLSELNPEKIVYISCNPKTLIRDLQEFTELGYTCSELELFDLFPQTLHVESMVILSK